MLDPQAVSDYIREALDRKAFKLAPVKGGGTYLEVKYRILTFQHFFPQGTIETKLEFFDGKQAVCSARVYPDKKGSPDWYSDGLSMHAPTSVAQDCVANASTSAIGRALTALGIGTEQAPDFEEPKDAEGNIVQLAEAPRRLQAVPQPEPQQRFNQPPLAVDQQARPVASPGNPMSERQSKAIYAIAMKELGDQQAVGAWRRTGPRDLTAAQASSILDYLKGREEAGRQGSGELQSIDDILSNGIPF